MSHTELAQFLSAQCEALNNRLDKYLWVTGEQIHHDPLCDKSREEWLQEFVCSDKFMEFAAEFRANWIKNS